MQTKDQKSSPRATRKRSAENAIAEAASGATGLSPLVGAHAEDISEAIKTTVQQVAKQPLIAAKHALGYAEKLVDVVLGQSNYQLARRDRRFADNSWNDSPVFSRLLQGYLALNQ